MTSPARQRLDGPLLAQRRRPPTCAGRGCDYLRGLALPARDFVEATLGTATGRRLDRWEMTRKVRKFRRLYQGWQESTLG
jgi:hypothetical protein